MWWLLSPGWLAFGEGRPEGPGTDIMMAKMLAVLGGDPDLLPALQHLLPSASGVSFWILLRVGLGVT